MEPENSEKNPSALKINISPTKKAGSELEYNNDEAIQNLINVSLYSKKSGNQKE